MNAEQEASALAARLVGATVPANATVWVVVALPIADSTDGLVRFDVSLKVQGALAADPRQSTRVLRQLLENGLGSDFS
jgi:hypothetical protein